MDALRDELFQARVLGAVKPEELLDWLLARNAALAAIDDARWLDPAFPARASVGARPRALAKAREHGLYLGMTWDWLHREVE